MISILRAGATVACLAGALAARVPATSAQAATPPVNTSPPTLRGTAQIGGPSGVSYFGGTWDPAPTSSSFQWQRCDAAGATCADIPGATGSEYRPVDADKGATIRIQETASGSGGTGTPAVSAPSNVIRYAYPTAVDGSRPTITGTVAKGSTLTVVHTTFDRPVTSYNVQWLSCDATGSNCSQRGSAPGDVNSYKIGPCDAGRTIAVQEAGGDSTGTGAKVVSDPTSVLPENQPWQTPCSGPPLNRPTHAYDANGSYRLLLNGVALTREVYPYAKAGDVLSVAGHLAFANNPDPSRYVVTWMGVTPSVGPQVKIAEGPTYTVTADDVARFTVILGYESASNDAGTSDPQLPDMRVISGAAMFRDSSGGGGTTIDPVDPGPSASQVKSFLKALGTTPAGPAAKLGALLRSGGYTYAVTPPAAGTVVVSWYQVPAGARVLRGAVKRKPKPVLVATGRLVATEPAAAPAKLKVKLTAAGRKAIGRAGRALALTTKTSFTPKGGKPVSKLTRIALKR